MKHYHLTILLFVLMSMMGSKASAQNIVFKAKNADGKSIWYKIISSEDVEVAFDWGWNKKLKGNLNIPATVKDKQGNSYNVTAIGIGALEEAALTSVTIPNSVTEIGNGAFRNCNTLTSITISNSVKVIKERTFEGCVSLTSINIPNSVKSIGSHAFSGCRGLTELSIPNSVKSIDFHAFSDCRGLTKVTIPNSVTSIGQSAFSGCTMLTEVTIADGTTTLNFDALAFGSGDNECPIKRLYLGRNFSCSSIGPFWGRDRLEKVIIGNNVTSIGRLAFSRCQRLTSVTIPSSVKSIGDGAFIDCGNLLSLAVSNDCEIGKDNDKVQIIRYEPDELPMLADNQPAEENLQPQQNVAQQPQPQPQQNVAQQPAKQEPVSKGKSDVDLNIPAIKQSNENTFAVIIGNEKYDDEADVPFAENDAKIFSEYCKKTLGVSEKHIRLVTNAGYNDIRKAINWLKQGLEAYGEKSRVIFYYAGHGIPSEADQSAFLLPADGMGSDIGSAYSLTKLYQSLSELPSQSVTVFLDACFSGAKRDGQMMASARGVAIKAKTEEAKGKMVVFSAAQGDQTAYPHNRQQHGLFTYYLLKKLQETKGNVTMGDLADYLTSEVKRESFDENNKLQTPTVKASAALENSWRGMKLK